MTSLQYAPSTSPTSLADYVNEQRLWDRHLELGKTGATDAGGVNRQALTPEDLAARQQVIAWARDIGAAARIDDIGNLFLRLDGSNPDLPPVMTGSHLDSQPNGGLFDGTYGVLAGLEVLEAIAASGTPPDRAVELVIWQNEEGCRFSPSTMGSGVYVGALDRAAILETRDRHGVRLADALETMREALGFETRDPAIGCHAYLEAHIEQGPILENADATIGVVTGVQGMRQYRISIQGCAAHAGTTPRPNRQDALMAAVGMISTLDSLTRDLSEDIRFTVGQITLEPNSLNTVAEKAVFTIDLRHPDDGLLATVEDAIATCARDEATCTAEVETLITVAKIEFDIELGNSIEHAAHAFDLPTIRLTSGATHDARFMATRYPSAMIFVPCRNGVSHNEQEWAEPHHLSAGARVLAATVATLCGLETNGGVTGSSNEEQITEGKTP